MIWLTQLDTPPLTYGNVPSSSRAISAESACGSDDVGGENMRAASDRARLRGARAARLPEIENGGQRRRRGAVVDFGEQLAHAREIAAQVCRFGKPGQHALARKAAIDRPLQHRVRAVEIAPRDGKTAAQTPQRRVVRIVFERGSREAVGL